MGLEYCANCERVIGKLEQAYVHGGKVVCRECYARLSNASSTEVMTISQPQIQHVQRVQTPTKVYIHVTTVEPPRVQTIEKTGKGWKALMVISFLAIVAGIAIAISGETTGVMIAVCGFLAWIFARIGAWWCHG
jgi:hypothetical protein